MKKNNNFLFHFWLFKVCDFFFSKSSDRCTLQLAKSLENSTLCLIKPHALLEGKCGNILADITSNGFMIKAMKMFNLRRQNCEEFYEVYNGVSSDYLVRIKQHSTNDSLSKICFFCYSANGDRAIQWTIHCSGNRRCQSKCKSLSKFSKTLWSIRSGECFDYIIV